VGILNIVFMGTPDFAVPALDALAADDSGRFAVKLVLTRPDSVSGRGRTLLPSPVRLAAERHGITVLTPKSFYPVADSGAGIGLAAAEDGAGGAAAPGRRAPDLGLLAQIAAVRPDIIIVAAYGLLLPRQLLGLPRVCCVNIHASLLPRWRGAAPIQRAILAGDQQTGVSIMRMEEGLDTGAVCATDAVAVGGKRLELLTAELAALGSRLLLDELPRIADGTVHWAEQDGSLACYAEKIGKRELALSPALSAEQNLRRVLASSPQAPARCLIAGRPVTLLDARLATGSDAGSTLDKAVASGVVRATADAAAPVADGATAAAPATATAPVATPASVAAADSVAPTAIPAPVAPAVFSEKRLLLATAEGYLQLLSLKPDGRRQMDAAAFASGVRELASPKGCPASWSAIDSSPA
jgi:methionyl-tRNA formyltransferase